jgi:hypothetical protein
MEISALTRGVLFLSALNTGFCAGFPLEVKEETPPG